MVWIFPHLGKSIGYKLIQNASVGMKELCLSISLFLQQISLVLCLMRITWSKRQRMSAWFLDSYTLLQHFFSHILFSRASHRSRLDSKDGKNRHFSNGDEESHSKEYDHLSIHHHTVNEELPNYFQNCDVYQYILGLLQSNYHKGSGLK